MKKMLLLFVLLSGGWMILTAQDHTEWKYTHPAPQPNNLRKIKMADAQNWYAVGQYGTFMKTTDAGASWYFHNENGRHQNAAKMIGQAWDIWRFSDGTLISTGEFGYIGRSVNGGVTFDSVGIGMAPASQRGQSIWFADQNTGYISFGAPSGSAGTILKTTDGGLTWSVVNTSSTTAFYSIAGIDAQTIYVASFGGAIYKTNDGGATWSSSNSTVGAGTYGLAFIDVNTGFASGGTGFVSKTTDGGTTWTAVNTPQTNWSLFQIRIIAPNEIYAVGAPDVLYKTTDQGATWIPLNIMPVSGPVSTLIWYSMDKFGSVMLLSGDFGVVAKSTDGGASWSSNHTQYSTQIMFDIDYVPGTTKIWAVGRQYSSGTGQRNIFYSSDMGSTWQPRDLGVVSELYSICWLNENVGYVSGTNSKVLKTTDGGNTWNLLTQPHTSNYTLQVVDFVNESTGWVFVNFGTVSGGNIFKTTDGGTTWTQQTFAQNGGIYSANMVDANTGYFSLNSSGRPIYKTTDGGTTWTAVTTPITGIIKDIKVFDANNLIISGSSGTVRLAKSTDGGATWTNINLPVTIDVNSIDFINMNLGYVSGNTTTVIAKTTDGGATWDFQNMRIAALTKVFVTAGDTAFVTGTYTSIRRYTSSVIPVELASFTATVTGSEVTLSWSTATEKNNQGFAVERKSGNGEFTEIAFVKGNGTTTGISRYTFTDIHGKSGRYDYRLKQQDFDGTYRYYDLAGEVIIGTPQEYSLEQNYPNPFNPSTEIRFSVKESGRVTVRMYDMQGSLVKVLFDDFAEAGYHSINFDASGLASGTYVYMLNTAGVSLSRKMVLIK